MRMCGKISMPVPSTGGIARMEHNGETLMSSEMKGRRYINMEVMEDRVYSATLIVDSPYSIRGSSSPSNAGEIIPCTYIVVTPGVMRSYDVSREYARAEVSSGASIELSGISIKTEVSVA